MKPATQQLNVFVVSDGTGETAEQIVKAALVQYAPDGVKVIRHKNIRTESQVIPIVQEAADSQSVIVFTMVSDTLRSTLTEKARAAGVSTVDLLGPLMSLFSKRLERETDSKPGLFHQVNDYYFKRIEAIEFTVKHDDGRYADNLEDADIILVGLSRTSKTPLSVYLSYKGWKVANVPVVKDIPLPERLFRTDQRKIIGLSIDPNALMQIRRERLIRMGDVPTGSYASQEHVHAEIEYCNSLFKKNRRWPVFDVTGKALEETATEVENYIRYSIPERYTQNRD
jgi:[pyruvate, water dikinase]-phosphate phosphotransferase / [pyruvate, water dikinase] kinase